jgi:MscS family membrane protein
MKAVEREDYERAVEYLDTKQQPKRAEQLALELQLVMDQGLKDDLNKLSRAPEGALDDGLGANRERVGIVRSGPETVDVQLERVQRGEDPPVWLFASSTLRRIPRVYDRMDAPLADRYLPAPLTQTKILHVSLWRWIAFIIVLPLLFVLSRLASGLIVPLLRPLARRIAHDDSPEAAVPHKKPLYLLVLGLGFYAYGHALALRPEPPVLEPHGGTITIIGLTWLSFRIIVSLSSGSLGPITCDAASGRIAGHSARRPGVQGGRHRRRSGEQPVLRGLQS